MLGCFGVWVVCPNNIVIIVIVIISGGYDAKFGGEEKNYALYLSDNHKVKPKQ